MSEAEKKAFILGMVSRNMPVIKGGDGNGIIDYVSDIVEVRLGLRQLIEEHFGSIFNFTKYMQDSVWTRYAIPMLGNDGLTETVDGSLFSFTGFVNDGITGYTEEENSPFVVVNGVLQSYTGSNVDITVPDYVETISTNAFDSIRSSLHTLNLANVSYVEESAFRGCSSLTSLKFSGTQRVELGDYAFAECTQLASEMPKNIYKFGNKCFFGCENLTGVLDLQSSTWRINYIGESAFSATGYTEVSVPYMMGEWTAAFKDMKQLENAVLDERIYELSTECFSGCTKLTVPTFCGGITKYGVSCCSNTSLFGSMSIYHKDELDVIVKPYAFYGCVQLTNLHLQDVIYVEDYAFSECSRLTTLTMSNKVRFLGDYCFSNNVALTTVKIPTSMHTIGDGVFSGCGALQTIEVPANLSNYEEQLKDGNNANIIYY